jgi:diguanylate cyclase (GGDEF)-like protein
MPRLAEEAREADGARWSVEGPSTYLAVAAFVLVGLLVGVGWMQLIPALASAVSLPTYAYLYAVTDLVAVGIILSASRAFGHRLLITLAAWFLFLHLPLWIAFRPENGPDLLRTIVLGVSLLCALWMGGHRRDREARLGDLALRDSVTGLANTRQFYADLERFLVEARRYGTRGAVLYLDIDKFKAINDIYGHRAGDEFLRALAGWLRGCVRGSDWVARIGGDEFAAILSHVDPQAAAVVAERIRATADLQEAHFEGKVLRSTASIGIARVPEDGTTMDEVLARADAAMYRAKARGGNRAEFYEE